MFINFFIAQCFSMLKPLTIYDIKNTSFLQINFYIFSLIFTFLYFFLNIKGDEQLWGDEDPPKKPQKVTALTKILLYFFIVAP